jgi:threonine aldolase
MHQLVGLAREKGLALHLDGARLFNAVAATGVSVAEYARPFDTVSFCLSKGLGAPIGSMIVADHDRVARLRRLRKLFGGGMRQVGVVAAAGIYALDHHITRLKNDHVNAKRLAELLQTIPSVSVDTNQVETNIIIFTVRESTKSTDELVAECKHAGVLLNAVDAYAFRVVTHLDVSAQDIEEAGRIFNKVFSN